MRKKIFETTATKAGEFPEGESFTWEGHRLLVLSNIQTGPWTQQMKVYDLDKLEIHEWEMSYDKELPLVLREIRRENPESSGVALVLGIVAAALAAVLIVAFL